MNLMATTTTTSAATAATITTKMKKMIPNGKKICKRGFEYTPEVP